MPDHDLPSPTLPRLKPRAKDSHKGSFGNALLIGGSRGMAGSIALSGLAAARTGAGLVRLAVPDRCLETVASFSPCTMTIPLTNSSAGQITASIEELTAHLEAANCIGIGPGMGGSPELQQLVQDVLRTAQCPVVVDADALNNLGAISNWRELLSEKVVLTPHPGEWSRLSGMAASDREAQVAAAIEHAKQSGATIVLKGYRTLVTDGVEAAFNSTGTPAMATGGSGDVLTGIITALICQGLSPLEAAHLGVTVHGLSGELAERALSTRVVLPPELIQYLPLALGAHAEQRSSRGIGF
ncbi:NAD(P)H-hydrate dehydratase [Aureliella helgolandensis]|uniref:ADP-dependent (S)-NAD(P)H-hydrate dehydratase n=1 Tax=Aureliella helgolandensis TaxID=2527968 RepID=A0A518GG06_9BACT|nr:NAD(P)H-hydrate dehydratase [Aureliella helgolandensis]QDV27478.1 ATP-dependent (S)-NAD(P)H-hydrate dehydratase [Aureliella helgolandensis]